MLDLRYYRQRRSDGSGDLFRVPVRGGTAERVIGDVSGAAAVRLTESERDCSTQALHLGSLTDGKQR
jgi:hypothetical protein